MNGISKIAKAICTAVSIISLFGISYYAKEIITNNNYMAQVDECMAVHHYILHSGTKRIHIDSCDSKDRMSDKNKVEVDDSIFNLVLNGYVVCGNCNAGIKGKNSFVDAAKLKEMDIVYYDVGDLPSYENFTLSVENMGKWYATHVSTYRAKFQTELLGDEFKEGSYIKEYQLDNKKYNVVVDNSEKNSIFSTDNELVLQRASKEAVEFYNKNSKSIKYRPSKFYKKTSYYPCELLKNSTDDYDMAGDDCVRFFFSLVNSIKPDFTYHLSKILKKSWSKINTADFTLKDSLVSSALYKLGFEIYDNVSRDVDIDKDGEPDYTIKLIDKNFKLEKGDILLSNDHLHVYMGSGINPANNYGWGRVYREYPRVYNFIKVNDNNGTYYLIKEENNNDHQYARIFRYVGER